LYSVIENHVPIRSAPFHKTHTVPETIFIADPNEHHSIQRYPTLPFTIIINPNSGPGEGEDPVPDERYTFEIARLNSFPNVTLLGYVRIDYCKREINKVLRDVSYYARWAGLKLDGNVDPKYVPEIKVSSFEYEAATHEQQPGKGRPAVKPKPNFLKSLSALRDRSPFRSRSKSPSSASRSDSDGRHQIPRDEALTRESLEGTAPANSNSLSRAIMNNERTSRRPLSMQGIFFDETPNIFSPSKATYLHTITTAVKNASGIGGAKLVSCSPIRVVSIQLRSSHYSFL
jgi:Spherulation-specific family 4